MGFHKYLTDRLNAQFRSFRIHVGNSKIWSFSETSNLKLPTFFAYTLISSWNYRNFTIVHRFVSNLTVMWYLVNVKYDDMLLLIIVYKTLKSWFIQNLIKWYMLIVYRWWLIDRQDTWSVIFTRKELSYCSWWMNSIILQHASYINR